MAIDITLDTEFPVSQSIFGRMSRNQSCRATGIFQLLIVRHDVCNTFSYIQGYFMYASWSWKLMHPLYEVNAPIPRVNTERICLRLHQILLKQKRFSMTMQEKSHLHNIFLSNFRPSYNLYFDLRPLLPYTPIELNFTFE